jgi:hypothetical protein
MAVVAEQLARAGVHEQELVAVAVAREVVHPAIGVPDAELDVGVGQHRRRSPRAAGAFATQPGEIEGARAQRAFPAGPAGRRVLVIHHGRRAEEAFLAQLALEGALGQVGVRLARGAALHAWKRDVIAGHVGCPLL